MVSGRGVALTAGRAVVQCAETARIARGLGSSRASAAQAEDVREGSTESIGEPWETKIGGMKFMPEV